MSNNNFLTSLFGKIFHGCWHHYNEWSDPKKGYGQIVYQEKECLKCGRVQHRRVSANGMDRKPSRPPKKTEGTPS